MIVGCYTMHLYCDAKGHPESSMWCPGEYTGKTEGECFKEAKSKGWQIWRSPGTVGMARCPECSKAGRPMVTST